MSDNLKSPRIFIVGHGRHGKDEIATMLVERLDYSMVSSSLFLAKTVIFDALKDEHGYKSYQEAFDDRHTGDNRVKWFNLIKEYNKDDAARLSREIFKENNLYVGIRARRELLAAVKEGVGELVVWVDGSKRHPPEAEDSMEITQDDADYVIKNNHSLAVLSKNVDKFIKEFNLEPLF